MNLHLNSLVVPRCENLIRSFETYHYEATAARPAKDGADHAIDALRYFLINRVPTGGKVKRGRY